MLPGDGPARFSSPHHRVLSALMPGVMEGWVGFHDAVAEARALSAFERDFVWIVVVAASRVTTGARHVREFRDAGGTTAQVEAAACLGAAARGAESLDAITPGWQEVAPDADLEAAYRRGMEDVAKQAAIEARLAHLAMAAAHAARQSWHRLRAHLLAACTHGADNASIAEALGMIVMPVGMPAFVGACATWLSMVEAGEVPRFER
jgi:alkylhydroperoxidase/carboxymuconolactone decarboxylase family protein YurZ